MATASTDVLTSVGYLLLKAGHQMAGVVDGALANLSLTGREFLVLTFVSGDEQLSQQDLSRRLDLDPTIVVALVDALEDRRLVTRRRDPTDRRRYLLSPTPAGRRLQGRAARAVTDAEAEFLARLAPRERDRLRELLLEVMRHRLAWLG